MLAVEFTTRRRYLPHWTEGSAFHPLGVRRARFGDGLEFRHVDRQRHIPSGLGRPTVVAAPPPRLMPVTSSRTSPHPNNALPPARSSENPWSRVKKAHRKRENAAFFRHSCVFSTPLREPSWAAPGPSSAKTPPTSAQNSGKTVRKQPSWVAERSSWVLTADLST